MPGYKETEVGEIPEEWDVLSLSELCKEICDGTHFTPEYKKEGIPFYSVENITANDFTNVKYISETEHAKLIKRCKPEFGDILMTRITAGIIGDTRIIDWDVNASIYVSLALLKPNERINSNYLYRYTQSATFVKHVEKRALINATPKKINMQDIGLIPIPVPRANDEQKAIASSLTDVDNFVVSLEKLIAKKQDIKTATMQQLLTGKKRLPGFGERKGYKQTELGKIPADWDIVHLRSCLDSNPKYGINAPAVTLEANLPTYIRITDISEDGRFIPNPAVGVRHPESSNYCLESGDLVFARTGASVGKCYKYRENDGLLVYAGFLIKISPDDSKLLPGFLFQYVKTNKYWQWVILMSMRSGQPGINGNEYGKLPISLPKTDEQEAICQILEDMDAEIVSLTDRLSKTKSIKQGMMQELLTGRTRLV